MNLASFNIYNASAGSGKTYTLVKEYLKILFESPYKDAYKNILAITFTNKAVGEMKERIIDTLKLFSSKSIITNPNSMFTDICKETNISANELSSKSKNILENIIHNYAAFDVSTIDKFTQRVIRAFAYDLHLPVNFEVELDTDTLLAKAIDNLIARAGTEKELTKTLIDFAIEKADDDKSWDISYDFTPIAKLLVNENHVPFVELLKDKNLNDFKELKSFLKQELISVERSITKESEKILTLIGESGLEHNDFLGKNGYVPTYFLNLKKKNFKITYDKVWMDKIETHPLYPKTLNDELKSVIDSIQPNIVKSFNITKQVVINYAFLKNIYNNITPLSVLNEISKEVNKIKQDQNLLLISEFNSIISNHIKEQPAPFIYERIGERFKHYFIDEFQDTSEMQWNNLIPLLENSLAGENGSLMLVGDAKQAIYRWRGGKAEQFIELYSGHNPFYLEPNTKTLPVNYRSCKEIIDFNNGLFKHLSSFIFSNNSYAELYKNSRQEMFEEQQGYVDINFLELTKEDNRNTVYPNEVLKIINRSLENGYELKDICVLVRKKNEGIAIAKHLSKFNIDIISSETLLVGNSPEVKFIVSLLKYILDPLNLEIKIEVLSYIANHKLDVHDPHLFYKEFIGLDIKNFFSKCNGLGFNFNYTEALQTSVYEVLEAIIYGFNLAETSNAYIQFFLDYALDYVNKNNSNLAHFITTFETQKESLTIVSPDGQNAVKIMTIHKSKGLEFPVVIFPYADLNIYQEKTPKLWFPLNAENFKGFPVAYLNYNKNIKDINEKGKQLYIQHQAELELDNINLLYVALTRPVEQLYIISSKPQSKNQDIKSYNEFFISYLKHIKVWEENNLKYRFGEEKRLSIKPEKYTIAQKQNTFISIPKKNHGINIITKSGYLWDTSQKEAIERGNLIHNIMSQIKTRNDIDIAFNSFISTGIINDKQALKLKIIVINIINHPLLSHLFSTNVTVYNEKDIITKQGEVLRPDRIVINEKNETIIVDYKTGNANSNHIKQIQLYSNALSEMSFKVTKRLLIYTNHNIEIKEV